MKTLIILSLLVYACIATPEEAGIEVDYSNEIHASDIDELEKKMGAAVDEAFTSGVTLIEKGKLGCNFAQADHVYQSSKQSPHCHTCRYKVFYEMSLAKHYRELTDQFRASYPSNTGDIQECASRNYMTIISMQACYPKEGDNQRVTFHMIGSHNLTTAGGSDDTDEFNEENNTSRNDPYNHTLWRCGREGLWERIPVGCPVFTPTKRKELDCTVYFNKANQLNTTINYAYIAGGAPDAWSQPHMHAPKDVDLDADNDGTTSLMADLRELIDGTLETNKKTHAAKCVTDKLEGVKRFYVAQCFLSGFNDLTLPTISGKICTVAEVSDHQCP